ncbi:MAG: bifunctional phosphoribosylaminoimidazolecarboxamide formyltransferase/IMP cyclohydrolase [Bacteroidetes bacterium GWF2_49_14]|nr:MAG: bifunctional phosphoribosylaminoimidazolecarboxamide formyltransferase/IMP cyclohydrolase [Bacteroidetes bacterium GWF2_49_14]HBB92959.1 bifunctional phosphoribosylaminoimidazolecarboxamide formyltransferase/IMP cyclohydrolase PurH [Bacteroidales bacterium]
MIIERHIRTALISVYHKDRLDEIVVKLNQLGVRLISTGGTADFIESLGLPVDRVESLTGYPSILGGRVKTLHPKVFGGILARRSQSGDLESLKSYEIPEIDLVIVDLYPFEQTVASGASLPEIIEKIDIGGISLIRAAAKNYEDVLIVPSVEYYSPLLNLLDEKQGLTTDADRYEYAVAAFAVSSHYDSAIYNHLASPAPARFRKSAGPSRSLRYGENPHQKGTFYGDFDGMFQQLHGKEISYNNLLDIEAAIALIDEFSETTFAILKHNNACGIASRSSLLEAWQLALAADPASAFGGILITNASIDKTTAEEINQLFFEIILAQAYEPQALEILKQKKNRIILIRKPDFKLPAVQFRSLLNGVLLQDRDLKRETSADMRVVTTVAPAEDVIDDLLFANILVKHTKSNAIVLAKNKQLYASGTGQTSRVDALRHAIAKARSFGFDLNGAVLASDAFFPFADSVEIAFQAGVRSVIQPGGSVRDQDTIDYCNANGIGMVFTGIRHFKH